MKKKATKPKFKIGQEVFKIERDLTISKTKYEEEDDYE